jgi:hypothetical protein
MSSIDMVFYMHLSQIMGNNSIVTLSENGVPSFILGIIFSSLRHPQANGQIEATNKTIFKILKKKLGDHKGDWAKDLLEVLWAY